MFRLSAGRVVAELNQRDWREPCGGKGMRLALVPGSAAGQRRRRCRATAAAVPPASAPTPAAAGMPTFAALRPVR